MASNAALNMRVSGAMPVAVGEVEPPPGDAWRMLLERSGARFDGTEVTDYGQPEAERGQALYADVMADLSQYGLIEVRGEDARKFLANLLTGDVRLVTPERGLFTAWCDAKGRARSTFWLCMHDGAFHLLLPRAMVPTVLAGLRPYLLRIKATLTDAGNRLARLGLSGPGLESRLAERLGTPLPLEPGAARDFGAYTLLAIAGQPHPRWLVIGEPAALAGLWQDLAPAVPPVGREAWNLLDILAGIPLLMPETAGEFIPQMLNMEALGGLCFTKGCYPGQEVIARLHYRGQLKRRLYTAYLDSGRIPAPGTRLHGDGAAESVGSVVSATRHPDGRVVLLAVVKSEEKDQAPVRLEDGPELAFIE